MQDVIFRLSAIYLFERHSHLILYITAIRPTNMKYGSHMDMHGLPVTVPEHDGLDI